MTQLNKLSFCLFFLGAHGCVMEALTIDAYENLTLCDSKICLTDRR